eukprot:scaffold273166_cov46-Prasinocladus_malaysianus.AAC.1
MQGAAGPAADLLDERVEFGVLHVGHDKGWVRQQPLQDPQGWRENPPDTCGADGLVSAHNTNYHRPSVIGLSALNGSLDHPICWNTVTLTNHGFPPKAYGHLT